MASFRKRGNKWDFRIVDKDKQLIAYKGGFSTKTEAKNAAREIELKIQQGMQIRNNMSLYDLWNEWFTNTIIPLGKSESTLYKHQLRGERIEAYFGTTPAIHIRYSQYQQFLNDYAQKVTRNTVNRLHNEVKKVVKYAIRDRIDLIDFTEGAIISGKKQSKKTEEKFISSSSDYYKILGFLRTKLNYRKSVLPYFFYIAFKTGMRFGEVLGLTWDCIDLEHQTIHTYRRYDSTTNSWKPPKTETSDRYVPIDGDTIEILRCLRVDQKETLNRLNVKNPDQFLFYDGLYGTPTNNGVNKALQLMLEELEIAPYMLTATGIRHTYASILLSKGVDIWVVAKVMGHKDITQVTKTYGHLLKEKELRENNLIRELLSEKSKKDLVEQK